MKLIHFFEKPGSGRQSNLKNRIWNVENNALVQVSVAILSSNNKLTIFSFETNKRTYVELSARRKYISINYYLISRQMCYQSILFLGHCKYANCYTEWKDNLENFAWNAFFNPLTFLAILSFCSFVLYFQVISLLFKILLNLSTNFERKQILHWP